MQMDILEKIEKPSDLKMIKRELLPVLAEQVRDLIIRSTAKNGGHLAASLGTVELTIALHYVLDCPSDKLIWDIGHQAYTHKILTGRAKKFMTLRQQGGISGFPNPAESEYDAFISGHSSTAISAALGYVCARDIKGEKYRVVAVVGDGSMTGGLAFEGLNNTGHLARNMMVILNDNEMFISHKIGAFSTYLAKLMTLGVVKKVETRIARFLKRLTFFGTGLLRTARRLKVLLFPGMLFEELGFSYTGPIDGHDIYRLIEVFENVKDVKGPVLIHVVTKKGKGYEPSEKNPIGFHGTGSFNIITGEQEEQHGEIPTYTEIFSKTVCSLAREDEKIVAVTAAMAHGTGLEAFKDEFPRRFFDVGIAEGHAVTFSAGLAMAGLKPVCALYSTFLQRAYDQVIHDVCLQGAPVVFAVDRSGIVGEDGATHNGMFDISFLRAVPGVIIMSPKDENEFQNMIKTAFGTGKPCVLRYPRGRGPGVKPAKTAVEMPIGKAELLAAGKDIALLAVGNMVHPCLLAAMKLEQAGIKATVANMRFIKPLDVEMLSGILKYTKLLVTVEENTVCGGFGSCVSEFASREGARIEMVGLPDKFIEHGKCGEIREKYGLCAEKIAERAKLLIDGNKP